MTTGLIDKQQAVDNESEVIRRRLILEIEDGRFYAAYDVPVFYHGITTTDEIIKLVATKHVNCISYKTPPNCVYGSSKGYTNHIFYEGDHFDFYVTRD